MGDRSSFLSLAVSDHDTQAPSLEAEWRAPALMPANEVFPHSATSVSRGASEAGLERVDSLLAPIEDACPPPHAPEEGGTAGATSSALRAFFAVHPGRAAATVSPEEEDALTQRRWRADAAEVEAFLTQLDLAREECAVAGFYVKAQACIQRMEQAIRLFAKRLHAETDAVASRTRGRMMEQHKLAQLDLRKQWRDKIAAYKRDAAALIAATEQHKYAQLEREDTLMRSELSRCRKNREGLPAEGCDAVASAPMWSKEVQRLQMDLQQLLRQHRYGDAERVRAQLQRLEKQETTGHQRGVTQRHVQRLQALKATQAAELAEMQAVQRQEVREMVLLGRAALDDLEQDHLAALQRVEDHRLQLHERAREVLRGYEHADVVDPKAAGLRLIRLSQLLWKPPVSLLK